MSMKKYWTLAKLSFSQQLAYRGNILMYRVGELANVLILLYVWIVLYSGREAVQGYTLPEMITYLTGAGIVSSFARNWVADTIERDVHRGRLSDYLLKPLNYFAYRFTYDFSNGQISNWFTIATYFLVILLLRHLFIVNLNPLTSTLFFLSVFLTVFLQFLIYFLIGLSSFWFTRIGGIILSFSVLDRIFSGSYMPLDLFPNKLEIFARFLPFAYTQYFSMQIYLGKISRIQVLQGLALQLLWIFILALIVRLVWKKAVKRFESVGI
jgi:ABC-2 type transport system permease protein